MCYYFSNNQITIQSISDLLAVEELLSRQKCKRMMKYTIKLIDDLAYVISVTANNVLKFKSEANLWGK